MDAYDREPVELLRVDNDQKADAWLRGYADAYRGRDLDTPRRHVEAYLRGFIAGLQARYGEFPS